MVVTGQSFAFGILSLSSSVPMLAAPNRSGRSSPISIKWLVSILLTNFPGVCGKFAPIVTGGVSFGLTGAWIPKGSTRGGSKVPVPISSKLLSCRGGGTSSTAKEYT